VNEDATLTVAASGVLTNDSDVDGNPLTAVLVTGPANGTLTLNSNGALSYTPNANFNGSDSFTYKANDGTADSNTVTVSITVNAVNDAPVAAGDSYSVNEDATLTVAASGVLTNDSDVDGNPLTAVLVTGPANGTLTLNSNGALSYTPNANFNGSDSFTYKANDGTADSNTVTVSITVNAVNDAPVAAGDSYSVNEDATLTVAASGVLTNDSDVDGNPLTAVLVTGPANGTLTLNSNGALSYTPNANFNGSDSFTYKANDGTADSNVATVSITVNPVNDAPIASDDAWGVNENTTLTAFLPGVLAGDSDVDGDPLAAVLVADPANGTLTLNSNGSFSYVPNLNYNGPDSFTYKANDGTADSNVATVSITVHFVNVGPVASDDVYIGDEDTPLVVAGPGVLGNDSDWEGDALIAVLVTGPTNGSVTLNVDGSLSYTPTANFHGSDSFTYKANDGLLDSNVVTVSITINAVNDAPLAGDETYAIDEDTTLNVSAAGVLGNDTDVEGSPLGAMLVAGPANGTLTMNSNGSFSYTPNANFNGGDSFTYKANDGTADSNVATVSIAVNSVNDAPVAADDAWGVNENTTLTAFLPGVLAGDSDVDGDPLTAALVIGPANGSLTLNANGSFSYVPNLNYSGPDSFTYKANDGTADSNVATVSITVHFVNVGPVASDDVYIGDEDTPLVVAGPGVLGNDSDWEGDALIAVLVTGPTNGSVTLNVDGSLSYTPTANFHGSDSFTYKANDGLLDSNVVTVSITVNAVNDAPVAVGDGYSVNEDATLTVAASGVLDNDSDMDGNPLTAALVSGPANGALTLNADGSFSYTPDMNFNGSDSFSYKANDGVADSNTVTVSITVHAVNDAPIASDDAWGVNENTTLTAFLPGVLANDSDLDGDPLAAILVTGPTSGTLSLNANGSFSYVPTINYSGSDSFTYKANDGVADSNVATVSITVHFVNAAPVASNDAYNVNEDTTLVVAVPGVLGNDNDSDNDALRAVLVVGPTNGSVTLNVDGSFSYTPNAEFNGADAFTYKANDGVADSNVATVSITVNSVNDAPVAAGDSYSVNEDATLTIAAAGVLGNDSDGDGNPLSAVLVGGPASGTLTLNANGSFSYTPNTSFNGSDSFTYKANDGTADSNTVTVSITVNAVNDAPVAAGDSYSVNEDATLTVAASGVLANDSDVDGNPLTAVLVTGPANGTLTLNSNGALSYTPNANFNGSDSFTYKANDGTADSNTVTVSITVNAVNDAPVAAGDNYSVNEDAILTVAASGVLTNDSDVDGNPLTAVLVTGPANGTLTLDADGSFSYTPNASFNGSDSFTYKANDGTADSNTVTVSITVNPVNDIPVLTVSGSQTVAEGSLLTFTISATDIDGDSLSFSASGLPAGASFNAATRTLAWTPTFTDAGNYTVSFAVSDGDGGTDAKSVSIAVNNSNRTPTAAAGPDQSVEGVIAVGGSVTLAGSGSDPDGDPLTYAWREGSTLLSTQAAPTLSLSYGSHTLTLTVTDSSGASASDSMSVIVADTIGPMITDVRFLAVKKTITGLMLKASEALNAASAANLTSYALHSAGKDKKLGTADDTAVPLLSAVYDAAARTIALTPTTALKAGQFFKLSVLDNGDITDLAGNRLDGDMNGSSGGDCVTLVARGTKIKYTDSNGDLVSLSLKKGGAMEMVRRLDGEGSHLRLVDLVPGTSALSAKVKASSLGGDGLTRLDLFSGAGSIAGSTASLPIQIGNTLVEAVDLLLAGGI
jgi:VCBS repeat-containing protein